MIWHKADEDLPKLFLGDRVLVIVKEMGVNAVIVLEYYGSGTWYSFDEMYKGYEPADGEYWALEQDVIASAISSPEAPNV